MYRDIVDEIKIILSDISGIGNIFNYIPWAENWNTIIDKLESNGIVNSWMISRVATETRNRNRKELAHTFQIIGIYELDDENQSELTFQALIDSAILIFNDNWTLNNTVDSIQPDWGTMNGKDGLQVDNVEVRKIGGKLCHYATCRLCALVIIE